MAQLLSVSDCMLGLVCGKSYMVLFLQEYFNRSYFGKVHKMQLENAIIIIKEKYNSWK